MIALIVVFGSVICFGAWWLLIETEGVYLGRKTVIWLYDIYASRYDRIKDFEPEYEFALLAAPIMSAIEPNTEPVVLDVATGTGRLPLALFSHMNFDGYVVGLDLSHKMLQRAATKFADFTDQIDYVLADAQKLPFEEASFDVVTCLESLEFMMDPILVVQELARVLRPGGVLLVTNRINTRWMPGHTFTEEHLKRLLLAHSMIDIEFEPWQVDYQRVWATKSGESNPRESGPLSEMMRCPLCQGCFASRWQCSQCGAVLKVDEYGIVDAFHVLTNPH